ncbi:hypothetical protein VTJ83DRAFT_4637 [Remersonia thermophila]|uniref:Uncharacterized protein n=1 Tax=Remersonia thermophila TaxID=72144 RepID=A0ABR4DBA5_9PEZI
MHLPRLNVYAIILAMVTCPLAAFAQDIAKATTDYVSGCPAVVSTADVCATCITLQCVVSLTVTAGCGSCAADAVPTLYSSWPCDGPAGCPSGCKTLYAVSTASADECGQPTAQPTPTGDEPTPTGGDPGPTSNESTLTGGEVAPTSDAFPPTAPPVQTAGAARMRPLRWW